MAVLRAAAAAGLDRVTWQLAWALDTFLDRQGHWYDLAAGWRYALFRDLGARFNQGDTLSHLADTLYAAGDLDTARTAWHQSLDILTELNHPDAEHVHGKLAGLDHT